MAIRAITIDYAGTIVRERHDVMMEVCRRIAESSARMILPADAARILWQFTHEFYSRDYTKTPFVSLRQIEEESIRQTLRALDSRADVRELTELMDTSSLRPEVFSDARAFFISLPMPAVVVTNADRAKLDQELSLAQLGHLPILCSEDAGAYKPRREIFEAALKMLDLPAQEVLHIGDSLTYDIAAAKACGMKTAWLNRARKPLTGNIRPDAVLPNLMELKKMMGRKG